MAITVFWLGKTVAGSFDGPQLNLRPFSSLVDQSRSSSFYEPPSQYDRREKTTIRRVTSSDQRVTSPFQRVTSPVQRVTSPIQRMTSQNAQAAPPPGHTPPLSRLSQQQDLSSLGRLVKNQRRTNDGRDSSNVSRGQNAASNNSVDYSWGGRGGDSWAGDDSLDRSSICSLSHPRTSAVTTRRCPGHQTEDYFRQTITISISHHMTAATLARTPGGVSP